MRSGAPSGATAPRELSATFERFVFQFAPDRESGWIKVVSLRNVADAVTGEIVARRMEVSATPAWDLVCHREGAPVGFYEGGVKPFPKYDTALFEAFLTGRTVIAGEVA